MALDGDLRGRRAVVPETAQRRRRGAQRLRSGRRGGWRWGNVGRHGRDAPGRRRERPAWWTARASRVAGSYGASLWRCWQQRPEHLLQARRRRDAQAAAVRGVPGRGAAVSGPLFLSLPPREQGAGGQEREEAVAVARGLLRRRQRARRAALHVGEDPQRPLRGGSALGVGAVPGEAREAEELVGEELPGVGAVLGAAQRRAGRGHIGEEGAVLIKCPSHGPDEARRLGEAQAAGGLGLPRGDREEGQAARLLAEACGEGEERLRGGIEGEHARYHRQPALGS